MSAAEAAGFEVLLTTDKNIRYQQNIRKRKIAVVAIGQGRWTLINSHISEIVAAVDEAKPGRFTEVEIPLL